VKRRLLLFVALVVLAGAAAAAVWHYTTRAPHPATATQVESDTWTCPMHPEVREPAPGRCPKCGMDLVRASAIAAPPAPAPVAAAPSQEPRSDLTLDTRRRQLVGVRTARVERTSLQRTIRASGVIRFDETRQADINVKLDGWIRDLQVDYTGQPLRRGQPLFTLYSPELLAAENEYLLALRSRDAMQSSQIADVRDQAERLVASARQRFDLWDVPAGHAAMLEKTRKASGTFLVTSPVSGFVLEKQAVEGRRVMAGESLYKVADVSTVWIEADVYEVDAPNVRVGSRAEVTLDGQPGSHLTGRAVYIYPYADEKTRTVKVRFQFPNRDGRLRPGMLATLDLSTPLGPGLSVPSDALLDSGTRQIVFLAQGDGYFEPRDVKAGQRVDGRVQILEGLKEGDEVVSGAAFFVDSESQLRAAIQGYQAPPPDAGGTGTSRESLDIQFRSIPDPPKSGEDVFEVTLKDAGGRPVTDADVVVLFYMAPMPSMNMPAMRSETRLGHVENGIYRAPGTVLMAGRWDVIVTVTRGGQRLGTRQTTTVAR
jgi:Cu(I)/Ag(I) efflux system membrane fusion protein/cobalt-zinc-cadmium efflux system membrane fusion protein